MNIQVQCCGIILLVVLLIFYLNQKKLKLVTEKAFFIICIAVLFSLTADVTSIIAIAYNEVLPALLVKIICKVYVSSIVGVTACCMRYVYVDIYQKKSRHTRFSKISNIILAIFLMTIWLLPIEYCYEPENGKLYSYGSSVIATYILAFFTIMGILALTINHKNKINPNRRIAIQIWLGVWILAAVIQAVNNSLLLSGYAECIGVVILYIKLENPEANLERKTGLFNQNALKLYLEQLYSGRDRFATLSISFEHKTRRNISLEENYQDIASLINYLERIPNAYAFNSSEAIIVVMNDVNSAKMEANEIRKFFDVEWIYSDRKYGSPFIVFVPNAEKLKNSVDLLHLMHYSSENNKDTSDSQFVVVGEDEINNMNEEKRNKTLLQNAMKEDRVEVFYQPIYSVEERKFVSAEALVRIRDDNGKIVPPGVFIPIAEKNGMILRLGEMVFEKVCEFIKNKKPEEYGIEYIEVNLSVIQCADEYLAERFINIMEKNEIDPKMINLEITESASLNAKRILLQNMNDLMDYGVNFSLDDFGTGQSNLNYIVDMPVDIVKFDRDMTNAYFDNMKASYVMDAAIRMIHGLKLRIVAEGIETREQYNTMEEIGISYIQGYYFSKPLPEDEFIAFIQKNAGL